MGYSFSEESLLVGAVVDDASLHSHVNSKVVSSRSISKDAGLFLCHSRMCNWKLQKWEGLLVSISKFKDK